jgi:imidazolonepropionase-like amidohydrolase
MQLTSQVTFPNNGAPFVPHTTYAFVNAHLQADAETLISGATLLVKDDRILESGKSVKVPAHAVIVDLKGKYIYPSFIDLFSDYGAAATLKPERRGRGPQPESSEKGAFGWNQAIRSHVDAQEQFTHNVEKADQLRKLGFGTVLCAPKDGIVRGSGPLVSLNSGQKETQSVITGRAAAFYSFSKGSSTQDYPTSLAGSIALLRQTYYDAEWYAKSAGAGEYNITLDQFSKLRTLPAIFESGDKYNALRAARVGKEFNANYIIKGSGDEYQRLSEIKATGLRFILPLSFPDALDVEDPYEAEAISLSDLKHWELAPTNPAAFEKAGIPFAFTLHGLKDLNAFRKHLLRAIRHGLSEKAALRALINNPADFIGAGAEIGGLKKGQLASFFVCTGTFFDEESQIIQHWVAGEPYFYADTDPADIRGTYQLSIETKTYQVKFAGNVSKPTAKITVDTTKREFSYKLTRGLISFYYTEDSARIVMGSGTHDPSARSFAGNAQLANGTWSAFRMFYTAAADSQKKEAPEKPPVSIGEIIYPFTAYGEPVKGEAGFTELWTRSRGPEKPLLITNVTVWTNEPEGTIRNGEVLIVNGKIAAVGAGLSHPLRASATVYDGKGMHLTPGVIDEHSHIALSSGVNEAGEASSAEVRMGDVINPDDINIYRQLSGGVTTSQLLHGSANPIGGQSALIKLRWGLGGEELKYANAPPFIKFALGENVKQANWGDVFNKRFPQTRMGVEQVYRDFFTRAREYDLQRHAKPGKGGTKTLRKDLELDALAEILRGERHITCHSYVQSEINMLLKVAGSLGFKVNTFTHILEGYKVADKMKAHGANASTFSDWWAYKNEVMEAIPHNAAIMTRMGICTAINSDDAEMARRLNQEAAKSVKYGGVTEEEALKMVTLNPARMLHIDHEVGSIKAGKSADLVLWTDHPLSVYAKAEKTIIDGRVYFDRSRDAKLREYVTSERARLITKMLMEKKKGGKVSKPSSKQPRLYHCNTIEGIDEYHTGHR